MDSDGDGTGDFKGLTRRLDYLHGLGVTAIWLMPFQVSPHRDDGYDVSDYYGVDPRYGTIGDFVEFTHGAKQRGIRVLIDLVVNHTSDEHPWLASGRATIHTLTSCSATIERAPALGKVAIRVRLEDRSVFALDRVTLEDSSVFGLNRVTGRGRKACCVSIPVKLAARLHPFARIPANSRIPADLGAIVPFSPIAAHRLHFATHALAAERLTDKHQQQEDSKHGVHQCSFGAPAGQEYESGGGGAHVYCWP